jgi:hypothetical protein
MPGICIFNYTDFTKEGRPTFVFKGYPKLCKVWGRKSLPARIKYHKPWWDHFQCKFLWWELSENAGKDENIRHKWRSLATEMTLFYIVGGWALYFVCCALDLTPMPYPIWTIMHGHMIPYWIFLVKQGESKQEIDNGLSSLAIDQPQRNGPLITKGFLINNFYVSILWDQYVWVLCLITVATTPIVFVMV